MTTPTLSRRLILGAGLAAPAVGRAQPQPARFTFKARNGQETDAERGGFEVPEDRRDPASRRIRLSYVRFPSRAARPGPPIIYLAGGPGASGSGTAAGARFPIFMALREVSDVIAFDQRGTGPSNHIPPRAPRAGPPPPLTREGLTAYMRDEFAKAWADWAGVGVAMRGYNTVESADDVDALRQHLGAEAMHLWGISYGTHLGLAILKRHGRRVDRVALASLEGLDQTVKRPDRSDLYMARVERLFAEDAEVRARVPDLSGMMRRVHARLEAESISHKLARPSGAVEVKVGGFALQLLAGSIIANPDGVAALPRLYSALDAGRWEVLGPLIPQLVGALGLGGMSEAMDLASGVSPARLEIVNRTAKSGVFGDALNYPMPHLIGAVPDVDLGEAFRAPFAIRHDALLIEGTLDGRTVLEEQAEVAGQFRNKAVLRVENAGHNVLEAHPEVQTRLVSFFKGERPGDARFTLPLPKIRWD